MTQSQRQTIESRLLAPFISELQQRGEEFGTGRKKLNQVSLGGQVFFQLADLWVPRARLAIEVESAGGVTNLGKFWYLLEEGLIKPPLTILHVYSQVSENDWEAHFRIWDLLAREMRNAFGASVRVQRFGCRLNKLDRTLAPALDVFRSTVDEAMAQAS